MKLTLGIFFCVISTDKCIVGSESKKANNIFNSKAAQSHIIMSLSRKLSIKFVEYINNSEVCTRSQEDNHKKIQNSFLITFHRRFVSSVITTHRYIDACNDSHSKTLNWSLSTYVIKPSEKKPTTRSQPVSKMIFSHIRSHSYPHHRLWYDWTIAASGIIESEKMCARAVNHWQHHEEIANSLNK